MSSMDGTTQIMKTTLANIDSYNFKGQFLAVSSNFEEFSRELLGFCFAFVASLFAFSSLL